MQITCPACGKKNDAADTCARCGGDLSLLRAIRAAAAAHLVTARGKLTERDWASALAHAGQSWELRRTVESARLACISAAALGDVRALERWRRRAED